MAPELKTTSKSYGMLKGGMGSFGLSVDRSNSACVIVRDTELQVRLLHGMASSMRCVRPRRDFCRMSPAVPQRPGTGPTRSSRSSLSSPSSTEKALRWDILHIPRLMFLPCRSFLVSSFLCFAGFLPFPHLLRSLVFSAHLRYTIHTPILPVSLLTLSSPIHSCPFVSA